MTTERKPPVDDEVWIDTLSKREWRWSAKLGKWIDVPRSVEDLARDQPDRNPGRQGD